MQLCVRQYCLLCRYALLEVNRAFPLCHRNASRNNRKIGQEPNGHCLFADAGGFRQIRADPLPSTLDCDWLEVLKQDSFSNPAQSSQDQVFKDDVLEKKSAKFIRFVLTTGEIRRHVPGARSERISRVPRPQYCVSHVAQFTLLTKFSQQDK